MRSAIAWSLALAVASAPVAALAQDWQEFTSADGYSSAVDPATIKASGTLRSFRLRVGKIGDSHYAIAEATLDCAGRTLTMGDADLYDKDVKTGSKAADPAKPFTEPLGDEPSGDAILAFVCTS
ncbi:MAG: hypothetical protein V4472_14130 [Pseudomonadota bacterium]